MVKTSNITKALMPDKDKLSPLSASLLGLQSSGYLFLISWLDLTDHTVNCEMSIKDTVWVYNHQTVWLCAVSSFWSKSSFFQNDPSDLNPFRFSARCVPNLLPAQNLITCPCLGALIGFSHQVFFKPIPPPWVQNHSAHSRWCASGANAALNE